MRGEHASIALVDHTGVRFIPTCVGNMIGADEGTSSKTGSSPHAWGTCRLSRLRHERLSVHPHMRGEHSKTWSPIFTFIGSSPHAWGTCPAPDVQHLSGRFIPTCVGNISSVMPSGFNKFGSSPHAWGTLKNAARLPFVCWFIPTCVGNILLSFSKTSFNSVHPHMRGEHFLRGDTNCHAIRFIPTCVGNISWIAFRARACAVHPHMRGEHVLVLSQIANDVGSSPHAWGTCNRCFDQHVKPRGSSPHAWGTCSLARAIFPDQRFIPTCVGNIPASNAVSVASAVHPHMRGEHVVESADLSSPIGSSPHAWGTYALDHFFWQAVAVHPHMRGEHMPDTKCAAFVIGSSPHAWGTSLLSVMPWQCRSVHPHMRGEHLYRRVHVERCTRFIPTCVGNISY